MNLPDPIFISESKVKDFLSWELTYSAVEAALDSVSKERVARSVRTFTTIPDSKNLLISMPGYLKHENYGAIGIKVLTVFPGNAALPTANANILLFEESTGLLQAVIGGTEITNYRTAVSSVIATKYLLKNRQSSENGVLGILGAGVQGRIHALAFDHFFKFREIRIWDRSVSRSKQLQEELQETSKKTTFIVSENAENCISDADVIITATSAETPVLKLEWIKTGAHINAIGVVPGSCGEVNEEVYKVSNVYVESFDVAKTELSVLEKLGVQLQGEIGGLISGSLQLPAVGQTTVFKSLGIAAEDCAMARMIFDLYSSQNKTCSI